MIQNFPFFMIISFFLFSVTVLFAWCRCKNMYITIPPISIGIIIFIIIYYISISEKSIKNYPIYLNPLSFIVISGTIPLGLFVGSFAAKQSNLISQGLTAKQYECISREVMTDKDKRLTSSYRLKQNLKCYVKLKNIIKFLFKKTEGSLI